jgi:eukaryotic-like serine/threonine-protein kinase
MHRNGSRYELIQKFAQGGMADLYLARAVGPEGFEKYVVVKRMLPEPDEDGECLRAFLDEARLAACLSHQNIVQVFEAGRDDDGYFIVMEYLHGFDLDLVLSRLRARGKQLPIQHAISIVAGAAAGLHYAHERVGPDGRNLGVIHRDVSPSNLVVTFDGGVKLIDFGIARVDRRRHNTVPGVVKGKIGYMSPEQCAGLALDRRSDIYTLGILLYELTTLHSPFSSSDEYDVMTEVITSTPRPPSVRVPWYPLALERIVMRCLSRPREARYQSALDLLLELEEVATSLRLPLSATALSGFMTEVFGSPPEPWQEVEDPDLAVRDSDPTRVYRMTPARSHLRAV